MFPPPNGGTISDALNRKENHAKIIQGLKDAIDEAAKWGCPNVITFSRNRRGMSDAEGADNCVIALNQVKGYAEDKGVNICMSS